MRLPTAILATLVSAGLSSGTRPNMASPTVNQGWSCSGLEGDGHQLAVDCKKVLVCRRRPVLPFVDHDVLFCDSVSTTIPDLGALSEWFCEVSTRSSTSLKRDETSVTIVTIGTIGTRGPRVAARTRVRTHALEHAGSRTCWLPKPALQPLCHDHAG